MTEPSDTHDPEGSPTGYVPAPEIQYWYIIGKDAYSDARNAPFALDARGKLVYKEALPLVKLQLDLLLPPLYLGNMKQLDLRLARILSGMMTIALHLELLLLIELEGMLGEVVVVGKLELGEAMNLEMELAKMLAPKLVALDLDPLLLALESDLPHMDLALWDQLDFEWARSLGIS